MKEQLQGIKTETLDALAAAQCTADLEVVRVKVLGKKGDLTQLLRNMGSVPPEERPAAGKLVNDVREELEAALLVREEELGRVEEDARLLAETLDVTIPGKRPLVGGLHPVSRTRRQFEQIFIGMGFQVVEGPEIELDYYNFELMNIPKNHPARDMQDTIFVSENIVLRTHTSPVQARTMLQTKPPIRVICPGRVYRFDEVDATHSPVFHQVEGLVVDKGIHMGHLKGTIDTFCKELFGAHTEIRFRPSFFPFTEPSAEADITCYNCGGKDTGCRVCKGTGWIELGGCGMVNPKVLSMCGIDPDEYSGFAFGFGMDRITSGKYSVSDIRAFFENDLRFLQQF